MKTTNRDMIIRALIDDYIYSGEKTKDIDKYLSKIKEIYIDDGGATEEAVIHYHINCPYRYGDKRAECHGTLDEPSRDMCVHCKRKWLDKKVDD